jgi:hypothetical protein
MQQAATRVCFAVDFRMEQRLGYQTYFSWLAEYTIVAQIFTQRKIQPLSYFMAPTVNGYKEVNSKKKTD